MKRNLVVCSVLLAAPAAASPTLVVEPSAPFSERDLQTAIDIRGGTDQPVRVTRRGDTIVVQVGAHRRVVELVDADPTDAARVVAIVIVGAGDPQPTAEVRDAETPVTPIAVARRASRLSMRTAIGAMRDDGGDVSASFTGALAFAVTPGVKVVGSLFVGEIAGYGGVDKRVTPLRLGVEGRAGVLALELGAQAAPERDCAGRSHAAAGVYGVARIYVPMDHAKGSFVVEGGAYHVEDQVAGCDGSMPVSYDSQALHLGLGVEWPL